MVKTTQLTDNALHTEGNFNLEKLQMSENVQILLDLSMYRGRVLVPYFHGVTFFKTITESQKRDGYLTQAEIAQNVIWLNKITGERPQEEVFKKDCMSLFMDEVYQTLGQDQKVDDSNDCIHWGLKIPTDGDKWLA